MDFVKLRPELAEQWDGVVSQSQDGWLYGLAAWQKTIVEVPQWGLDDQSFAAFDAGRLMGVMPLEMTSDGRLCSTPLGASGPIAAAGLSPGERETVMRAMIDHAREVAGREGAGVIEISIPPLCRTSLNDPNGDNALLRYGFEDASTHSWIIDLRRSKEEVQDGISRNARRKIKEATGLGYSVRPIRDRVEMDVYYDIHCETYHRTGVSPHPKEYFLGIYDRFTSKGLSKIWVAVNRSGTPVAFTNIGIYKNAALYWTTCCRDHDFANGVYYLLLWHAIESAKSEGVEWFDCAEAFPGAPAGSKEKGLSDFKSKFGGELHRYWKGRIVLRAPGSETESTSRRALKQLRGARSRVESLVGKTTSDVLALPFRSALRAVRAVRGVADPQVMFIKPYWQAEEMKIGRGKVRDAGDALEQFKESFRKKLGLSSDTLVVPTGSGRTALEVALKALKQKFPGRREVVIPSYGCKGTFTPVINAGLVPVFADINNELLTDDAELERLFCADTLAVLLVHLCGKKLETARMVRIARERGITPIEDHCQNLGGGRGDSGISIYAFGMGKNAMGTAGGALVANLLQEECGREARHLSPEKPEAARERFSFFEAAYFNKGDARAPENTQHGYVEMNPLDALLMVEQFGRLDEILARRKSNAARLRSKLSKFPDVFFLQAPEDHIYTKLSVRMANRRLARRFHEWMVRRGIELEVMYVPLHLRWFGSAYASGPLTNSEAIYPLVVNLPVRPNLTDRELKKLETAIEEFGKSFSKS